MATNTPPAAVIRAARTLERYEVRELLRVAPNRDASLAGPARLLDAIRAWRAVFDPPKTKRFTMVELNKAVAALRQHNIKTNTTGDYLIPIHPSNAKAVAIMWKRAAKKLRMP